MFVVELRIKIEIDKGNVHEEIYSLKEKSISYAVGCMFGRCSLDVDGLACAGSEWDKVNSTEGGREGTLGCANKYASFPVDEYFEDDIVGLFVEFVKTIYGAETLDENLKFIADALGGKGQPKDVIRNARICTDYVHEQQAQDTEIGIYKEKIHHLADQMISIDLNDGVKKNYAIFQDVLAKIK